MKRQKSIRFLQSLLPVATAIGLVTPAHAAEFRFVEQQAPLALGGAPISIENNGNNRTVRNAISFVNTGQTTIEDLIFITPFLWVNNDGRVSGLEWENSLGGWNTPDFDGVGNSVTVRLLNPDGQVALGKLGTPNAGGPIPLTIPCNDNPSCPPAGALPPLPPLTQDPEDAVSFTALGDLTAGEIVTQDLTFSFDFSDNRTGTLPLFPVFATFVPFSQSVPEPAVLSFVLVGGVAMMIKGRSHID